MREQLLPLVTEKARKYQLDPRLLDAIIQVESGYNPYAVRLESTYRYLHSPESFAKALKISLATEKTMQRMSWGLGQIMGGTARYMGHKESLLKLSDPALNLEYCCRYLVKLKIVCKSDDDLIAAYNAGAARKDEQGRYLNQGYVDRVNALYLKE